MADERTLSKIEFYEHVPITTDFKHSPLFDSKQEQIEWFTQFRNDSLTFSGSYQRTEEQIRTKFKVEQLLNVNYVHVTNPSYDDANKDNSEWWGHVLDIHYINDGLVIVDWVVDPIQTFMFKWDLGKATIERGMINAVKEDEDGNHYLDEAKASILNNSEPVGVDGMAYALAWDNVMSGKNKDEENISYLVIVNKDTDVANLVGMPSQLSYFVLPYSRRDGQLLDFTIQDVKTGSSSKTITTAGGNSNYTIMHAVYLLSKDENFGKAGANILTSYIQNEVGFAFDFDDKNNLITSLSKTEWTTPAIGDSLPAKDNMELFSIEVKGAIDSGESGGSGGDNSGEGGSGDIPADEKEFLKLPINYDFKVNEAKMIASVKQSAKGIARLGGSEENIKRVVDIVRKNGMSPEMFFAYELQENGTSLGWLNHTSYTGDPYTDAESVSKWAVQTANSTGEVHMAWDDISNQYYTTPADKQAAGQDFANKLPSGTIGRLYLAATAAACWALFDREALSVNVNQVTNYGDPVKGCMDLLNTWK